MSSVFLDILELFPKAVVSVSPPTSRHECFHHSMSSQTLGIAIILNIYGCDRCEMVSHYGYNLHSTKISEVEHIFIYLLFKCIFPVNCLLKSLAHFLLH